MKLDGLYSQPSTGPWYPSDGDDDEAAAEADEFLDPAEVGDARAGRLVAPDEGLDPDDDHREE